MLRFSDNCQSQFKSRYTMAKLVEAPTALGLHQTKTCWVFYEPDHGQCSTINLQYCIYSWKMFWMLIST